MHFNSRKHSKELPQPPPQLKQQQQQQQSEEQQPNQQRMLSVVTEEGAELSAFHESNGDSRSMFTHTLNSHVESRAHDGCDSPTVLPGWPKAMFPVGSAAAREMSPWRAEPA